MFNISKPDKPDISIISAFGMACIALASDPSVNSLW